LNLSSVPVHYLGVDSAVFKVNDRVVCEYPRKNFHKDLADSGKDKFGVPVNSQRYCRRIQFGLMLTGLDMLDSITGRIIKLPVMMRPINFSIVEFMVTVMSICPVMSAILSVNYPGPLSATSHPLTHRAHTIPEPA